MGLPALREAIAADSTARRGVTVDPATVVVTPGAKPIMFFAILALAQPGDEVIYPDPGFPIYESMTRFVGAHAGAPAAARGERLPAGRRRAAAPREPPDEADHLQLARQPHRRRPDAGRPAGIADVAGEHDITVLADEIYMRILYDGAQHHSIASFPGMAERTIVLDGFSKTYAMTGWRLGYGIVPEALVPAFGRLVINSVSCVRLVRAGRRGGGADGPAGLGRGDGHASSTRGGSWSSPASTPSRA